MAHPKTMLSLFRVAQVAGRKLDGFGKADIKELMMGKAWRRLICGAFGTAAIAKDGRQKWVAGSQTYQEVGPIPALVYASLLPRHWVSCWSESVMISCQPLND